MPRLLHMADVHLGARHDDLGPAAAAQRERQFDAFKRAIDLALSEKVDLVLICGDLFDSNSQPRRSVERAAGELGRLVQRHIPAVIIPGTHDCYDAASIYRVFNLSVMAGAAEGSNLVTVLTDSHGSVDFPQIPATVRAKIFPAKRAGESPLPAISIPSSGPIDGARNWQIGMVHGSMAVPGRFDGDDVSFTEQEVAQSNLDYLALGHWHSFRQGKAGRTVWAYSGAPEAVAVDQDGAGQVLIVTLDDHDGQRAVSVEPRPVGRTVFQKLDVDAATLDSQAALEGQLKAQANPDLVLDVRVLGVRSNSLDLNADELERQLTPSFLRLRVRDSSIAALSEDPIAPADTILGAFTRDLRTRIAEQEQMGDADGAAESREALRIGLALLDDPSRVTLA
jgi:DNA repair exonuclease SbcCD nuclease subunit